MPTDILQLLHSRILDGPLPSVSSYATAPKIEPTVVCLLATASHASHADRPDGTTSNAQRSTSIAKAEPVAVLHQDDLLRNMRPHFRRRQLVRRREPYHCVRLDGDLQLLGLLRLRFRGPHAG